MDSPQLSPNGQQVLLRVVEATADGAKAHLWLTGVHGEEPRQITFSPESDKAGERQGQWMPDGKSILFVAKRDEHAGLYRLPMDGGEAKMFELKITPVVDQSKQPDALPTKSADGKEDKAAAQNAKAESAKGGDEVAIDVGQYAPSPDGKWIAIVADDPETPGEKAQKEAKADASWVDHDPHGSRLYLLDTASSKLTLAAVAPDVRSVAWSADGTQLVAIAEAPNDASDLAPAMAAYTLQVSDLSHPGKLDSLPRTLERAAWSLDGKSLFYLAQAERDAPPGYADLYRYDLAAKTTHDLSDGMNGSIRGASPIPLADGSVVQLMELGFNGKAGVFATGGSTPEILVTSAANLTGIETNQQRTGWLFLGSSGGRPAALLYSASLRDTPTPVKTPLLTPEHLESVAPKRVKWKSDGYIIEGRLYLPTEVAQKVPLIVEVHGGPLGAYSDEHEPWIDFLVGRGWAVLRTNPRGSSGYGAAFAAANKNDLGGGDYRDIMAGVDFVLQTEPVDSSRMALMGYSYGGEMAAFVEGKTTRFKAIISGAPVIDQYSEYGTEDQSWYDRWYFGKPWERPQDAWRQSPLAAAGKAKTPFLLLQGEGDTTDPLGQSQEMYRALRQSGVPVELVTYPRDNHGPLAMALYGYPVQEPWHGFDARRRVVDFIEKNFAAAPK